MEPDAPAAALAYQAERDAAVAAAQRAARYIRAQDAAAQAAGALRKDVHDFVTATDEAAQRLIVEHLAEAFPSYAVLAEEGTETLPDATADGHRWIIDPIDGTTNFMHGVAPYAVSIALQQGSEVVVGVVLDVASDELFTAVRGGGCYLNGARVVVSPEPELGRSLLATGFPYRRFGHLEQYLDALGRCVRHARGVRRHGAASVDLARVACGRFGGFFETGLQPWDVAAGTLLVREAGGRVTTYDGGAGDPVFGAQILATNGAIHRALQALLEPMRDVRE